MIKKNVFILFTIAHFNIFTLGDLQIDGDYGDDDVTNVKKHEKVNDAREMEFEQNMVIFFQHMSH